MNRHVYIHDFLHTRNPGEYLIMTSGARKERSEIMRASDGSAYIISSGVRYTRQNPGSSLHGELTRKGHKITWISGRGSAMKIFDGKIIKHGRSS